MIVWEWSGKLGEAHLGTVAEELVDNAVEMPPDDIDGEGPARTHDMQSFGLVMGEIHGKTFPSLLSNKQCNPPSGSCSGESAGIVPWATFRIPS